MEDWLKVVDFWPIAQCAWWTTSPAPRLHQVFLRNGKSVLVVEPEREVANDVHVGTGCTAWVSRFSLRDISFVDNRDYIIVSI